MRVIGVVVVWGQSFSLGIGIDLAKGLITCFSCGFLWCKHGEASSYTMRASLFCYLHCLLIHLPSFSSFSSCPLLAIMHVSSSPGPCAFIVEGPRGVQLCLSRVHELPLPLPLRSKYNFFRLLSFFPGAQAKCMPRRCRRGVCVFILGQPEELKWG
jgi:hypothetical protein